MNERLEEVFLDCCRQYGGGRETFGFDSESSKQACLMTVELRLLKVEFVYVKKESAFVPPSTLYCRLYLHKNSGVFHHLPDLLGALEIDDFRACYFSYIENETRMRACFSALAGMLDGHLPAIELALREGKGSWLREQLFSAYRDLFDMKEDELDFSQVDSEEYESNFFAYLQGFRNDYCVNAFTKADAYHDFLTGNLTRSIKRYEKRLLKTKVTVYEKRLFDFLHTEQVTTFTPISPVCFSQKIAIDMTRRPHFGRAITCFLAFFLPCAIVFLLTTLIIQGVLNAGCLVSLTAPWYTGLIMAAACSVFGAIAFRKPLLKLTAGKKAGQVIEFDSMMSSRGADRAAYIFFGLYAILTVVLNVAIVADGVWFYEDHFAYFSATSGLTREQVPYETVDTVYYIGARYNEYGDRLERASYVIVMKDGSYVDLDGYTSVTTTEISVLPLLTAQQITVRRVDSDRDLPVVLE